MTGALAAREVDFQNNGDKVGFFWDANAFKVLKPPPGDYGRRGWRECRPEPSVVGDPESGC